MVQKRSREREMNIKHKICPDNFLAKKGISLQKYRCVGLCVCYRKREKGHKEQTVPNNYSFRKGISKQIPDLGLVYRELLMIAHFLQYI